jgi:hypothetical protein
MAEVLVATDELTVLGGPAEISVDVDFGPKGDRGSLTFYGNGKPNLVTLPEEPQAYDLYINLLTTDDEYLWMYQYVYTPGGFTWEPRVKLIPNVFSDNNITTFTSGSTTIPVLVNKIVPTDLVATLQAENFNVQYNIQGTTPIASSMSVGEIYTDVNSGALILPLTITAHELSEGEWVGLSGTKTVHLHITVV